MTAFAPLLDDLASRRARAARGGPESARERHLERGKLLPRDRVEALLDDGTAFLGITIAPAAVTDPDLLVDCLSAALRGVASAA